MIYDINPDNAVANVGNWKRLWKLMEKAEKGENLTMGFLGGSITMGSVSSTPKTCYAYLVFDWWQKKFPKASFTYVNAGIGGTTSQFGVARVHADLLQYNPDFVITEFSVNDENEEHFLETYEGMIRNIYAYKTKPAMLIVNNVCYNTGKNAQEQHNKIGKEYQIPCISMQSSIYPQVAAGVIPNREITLDDLHPNDKGHQIVADIIIHFLEKVNGALPVNGNETRNSMQKENMHKGIDKKMPAPITRNAYEHSTRYQNRCDKFVSNGFLADTTKQETITQFFRNGWTAGNVGDSITFQIKGTGTAVQFRKSVNKPTPVAIAIVDGDEENAVTLDGNFEETWGDCLYLQTLTKHAEMKTHKVEIRITETHAEDVVPFYLVSVIGSY